MVAGLLRRLWLEPPAGHTFRPLAAMCQVWADEFEHTAAEGPASGLDAGLLREGVSLFRELPASAEREVLLCTDLHAGNVLAARREPWLVIDPKPYVGDPTYDARCSTYSTAIGCVPTPANSRTVWPTCWTSTRTG